MECAIGLQGVRVRICAEFYVDFIFAPGLHLEHAHAIGAEDLLQAAASFYACS